MNVTEQLRDLVADEPPYRLDPEGALAGGRRRARRRTAAVSGSVALALAVAAAGVLALRPEPPRTTVQLAAESSAAARVVGPLERIVRQHTPADWTFAEVHETADTLVADVDDGYGAGRFSVGISPSPGSMQQHPCSDHEFALDGPCREVDLDADTRLITRGPAASGPVTSSYAVIVHRDGSGVHVGADSAIWRWPERGILLTPEDKARYSRPAAYRNGPVYSVAQLVEIAKAVDAAT